jgi:dihydropteroate synthase
MITRVLNVKPEDALNGTTTLNTLAILQGASILRVHDVIEARQVITLLNEYSKV